jgi:hypothetical protein
VPECPAVDDINNTRRLPRGAGDLKHRCERKIAEHARYVEHLPELQERALGDWAPRG